MKKILLVSLSLLFGCGDDLGPEHPKHNCADAVSSDVSEVSDAQAGQDVINPGTIILGL